MVRITVSKTVVAHPDKARFAMHMSNDTEKSDLLFFSKLDDLAETLRQTAATTKSAMRLCYIDTEAPCDIEWIPAAPLPSRVREYERLTKDEMHKLAQLLKA